MYTQTNTPYTIIMYPAFRSAIKITGRYLFGKCVLDRQANGRNDTRNGQTGGQSCRRTDIGVNSQDPLNILRGTTTDIHDDPTYGTGLTDRRVVGHKHRVPH